MNVSIPFSDLEKLVLLGERLAQLEDQFEGELGLSKDEKLLDAIPVLEKYRKEIRKMKQP